VQSRAAIAEIQQKSPAASAAGLLKFPNEFLLNHVADFLNRRQNRFRRVDSTSRLDEFEGGTEGA